MNRQSIRSEQTAGLGVSHVHGKTGGGKQIAPAGLGG